MNEEVILPIPERSGYIFKGFYDNASLSGNIVTKISIGSVFDKEFYAAWEEVGLSDLELLDDAKNELDIILSSGDSLNSVTKDITLPLSGINGVTVTWSSSNTTIINNYGVVTRSSNDVVVTLTATLTLNGQSVTKVFTLSGRNIAKTFLDWIYQDADMYLDRKYKRYLDYYNIAV